MVNEFDNTKMLQVTAGKKGNGNELKSLLDEVHVSLANANAPEFVFNNLFAAAEREFVFAKYWKH